MSEETIVLLISALVFLTVIGTLEGVFMLWRATREVGTAKVHRRLRAMAKDSGEGKISPQLLRSQQLSHIRWINSALGAIPRAYAMDRWLEQAGLEVTVSRFIGYVLLLAGFLTLILSFILKPFYITSALLGLVTAALVGYANVSRRRTQRLDKIGDNLPAAMDFIARSLRAGNPFSASLKAAAQELPDPIGTEFGITFDEMNYGLELEDALHNLGDRTGSEDLRYFIAAVLIQKTTGGNLANVLNQIAKVMRNRAEVQGEIRIQASEMKISAHVLTALPFVIMLLLALGNPNYLSPLITSPIGRAILAIQGVLILIGYLIMRKMVHFRI